MQRRFSRRCLYLRSSPQADVQTVHLGSCSHSHHYSASLPLCFTAAGRFTTLKDAPPPPPLTHRVGLSLSDPRHPRPPHPTPRPPPKKRVVYFPVRRRWREPGPHNMFLKREKEKKQGVQRGVSPVGRPRSQLKSWARRNKLSTCEKEKRIWSASTTTVKNKGQDGRGRAGGCWKMTKVTRNWRADQRFQAVRRSTFIPSLQNISLPLTSLLHS